MSLVLRTVIFVALVAATVGACKLFRNPKTNPEAGVVVWLPNFYNGVEGRSETMGEEEKRWLPTDTTFYKSVYPDGKISREVDRMKVMNGGIENDKILFYEGWAARYGVAATLIVAGSDSRSLHRPEVCLKAQGWAIDKREVVALETEGGLLEVMDYHLSRVARNAESEALLDEDGKAIKLRAHYVFWWVGPDASTPWYKKRVWLESWNSILKGRKERWAYPSVMTWVNPNEGEDAGVRARARIYEFVREVAPEFQESLGAEERRDSKPLRDI
jgi:hypothetical protein